MFNVFMNTRMRKFMEDPVTQKYRICGRGWVLLLKGAIRGTGRSKISSERHSEGRNKLASRASYSYLLFVRMLIVLASDDNRTDLA